VKLAISIVHNRDKGKVTEELVRAGFKFTIIGSTGGFLREGNTTFLLGIEDEEIQMLKQIFAQHCQTRDQVMNVMPFEASQPATFIPAPVKVPVGGAVLFLLDVEQFHRF
jgi:uncharacterized protein YaaQ